MDQPKLEAEIAKLMAETAKLNKETFWYPVVVASGIIATVAAIVKILFWIDSKSGLDLFHICND